MGFFDSAGKLVALIVAIVGAISAFFGLWYSVQDHNKKTVPPVEIVDHHARVMELYQKVSEAVHDGSPKQERLALGLVESFEFAPSEQSLKSGMLDTLSDAKDPAVRAKAANEQFQLQDAHPDIGVAKPAVSRGPASDAKPLGDFNVDVFWCEGSPPSARKAADDLAGVLAGTTNGRVRSRIMPLSKREGSYVNIPPAQVRREDNAQERPLYGLLSGLASRTLIENHIITAQSEITLHNVITPTPGYVSLFVCPKA